jgi:hypothetical protein
MPRAYVLINVVSGSEDSILKQLRGLSGVTNAYVSYGVYDLLGKVEKRARTN